ncbi:MAG: hypothetical protein UY23_C0002G0006 [Candidatus Jorgensenbacteria bacterium GW2011_GWA1_48_11]|uniref:Cohesin domain-containing protein n=1 Tax=Candidatus Jorgensenbacteria bacterium GW2011_GWA1_48_11 TaxID=1618660 RepID=A0A0G1UAY5_9BACT|nr:MAG: hypothetical protein UY23_C0002G0006 [Candidatus Jorgensenbacteria bacterium GW2011_GWA1_48_11]KKW12705.1 MAG: hypothetical protein UY51_C0001G0005 [Candidatus Jorgensenbacteria bacterium GW2011_GWB1_49_9]
MKRLIFTSLFVFGGVLAAATTVSAATFSISPSTGTFTVGSTFDVSVLLDTKNQSVNAVQMVLNFPPDKLQLVSPAASRSVIGIWTGPPQFNNQTGEVNFQGGIPNGINVSSGLITNLTFRIKSVGQAVLKFSDSSKVLLNDGLGTDVLSQTQNAIYDFVLPSPAGPIVVSKTNPDQTKWYKGPLVTFDWASSFTGIQGFSYIFNDNPVDEPDKISEGMQTRVAYQSVADGTHYFHVRSLRDGTWGGTTDFAVNVDASPPADFKIQIIPSETTARRQPIIQFFTTDANSGIDHYELKLIPLSVQTSSSFGQNGNQQFFVETQNPYVTPPLQDGDYDVIVRVYDKAGNYRDVTQRLQIRQAIFEFLGIGGLRLRSYLVIPWFWFFLVGFILLGILILFTIRLRKWHREHDLKVATSQLPGHIKAQLEELKNFRKKYRKSLMVLLLVGFVWFGFTSQRVMAQDLALSPPLVTNVSKNITDQDIFYIGGKTDMAGVDVIIYIQNLRTGGTMSEMARSDQKGDWFYRNPTFLMPGNYLLWAQARLGDVSSPPSPQIQISVAQTAIQFGASRLSYEVIYLILIVVLFLAILILIIYLAIHSYRARIKNKRFLKEVKEAEESVRRGFAVLRRDIHAELDLVKKAKFNRDLSVEEKNQEAQMLKDLEAVEKYISKEIWEVENSSSQTDS